MKIEQPTPENMQGLIMPESTCFHHFTLATRKKHLTALLGFEPEEIMDKAQYEWELKVIPEKGEPFLAYIYDWKEDEDIDDDTFIDWHIGTETLEQSKELHQHLKRELTKYLHSNK